MGLALDAHNKVAKALRSKPKKDSSHGAEWDLPGYMVRTYKHHSALPGIYFNADVEVAASYSLQKSDLDHVEYLKPAKMKTRLKDLQEKSDEILAQQQKALEEVFSGFELQRPPTAVLGTLLPGNDTFIGSCFSKNLNLGFLSTCMVQLDFDRESLDVQLRIYLPGTIEKMFPSLTLTQARERVVEVMQDAVTKIQEELDKLGYST
jgi:hypothetical protein